MKHRSTHIATYMTSTKSKSQGQNCDKRKKSTFDRILNQKYVIPKEDKSLNNKSTNNGIHGSLSSNNESQRAGNIL